MLKAKSIAKYLTLIILAVVTVFPIFYTIMASFKTNMEIMVNPGSIIPKNPTFDNYIIAWKSPDFNVFVLFLNSLIYTVINMTVVLFTSAMNGYVFAWGEFKFKKVIFGCFTALMFIQTGGIGIYATFQILDILHLPRTLWTLIALNAFGVPIINIYLVKSYITTLPNGICEAAKIDGCSFFGIFMKIIFPLLKPVLATIAILSFQGSWNDYIMPTIFTLTKPEQRTLMVGLMILKNSGNAASSWNLMLAGSTIALLPVLAVYAMCNKYFVTGLTVGAMKG